MAITDTTDQVRLLIGDTDTTAALLSDEEIDWFLSERSDDVHLAAADACDALATKFARAYDFETDGQSFKRSQMSAAFAARASELRSRGSGITTGRVTRVDGYSDDIQSGSVAETDVNPRRRYYGAPDRIP